jgi:ATP-dependent helicase/nuclease subunit A
LPEARFRLSATDLASLLGGYSELRFDEATQIAYVEEIETSPDDRHGDDDSPADVSQSEQADTETEIDDSVTPRVFGELVHRLCELRPPESQWADLMAQTLADEGAEVALTTDLQQRVRQHAQRGIDYVEQQARTNTVEQQYDELYVTAEFERGEIAGYIDHLLITPDEYHIIDYKTGSVDPAEVTADAEYYANQMKAYAIALHQQNSGRDIRASLVFTEVDEVWETTWTGDEIESIKASLSGELTIQPE